MKSKTSSIVTTFLVILIIALTTGFIYYNLNLRSDNSEQIQESINEPINKTVINGPVIEVSPTAYDFGTVVFGEVAEHVFQIKNSGNQSLKILKLSTSCGCTKASVEEDEKTIAPGDSADMLVTFDPSVHKDDHDLGYITRIVYIKTNDSEKPEIEVEITANVIK